MDLTVRKVWEDEDDPARPGSLIMVLFGGGTARPVTLNAANHWTATVTVPARDEAGQDLNYTWEEPAIRGYTLRSVVTAGRVTTFTNVKDDDGTDTDHLLTIRYRYADGTFAADTYTRVVRAGDAYDVPSPVIPGYRAVPLSVTGVMPARDMVFTVIYVPEDQVPDDPGASGGLGEVILNVGDCLE